MHFRSLSWLFYDISRRKSCFKLLRQRTFSSNLQSKVSKLFLFKGVESDSLSLEAKGDIFFRNVMFLRTSIRFVCSIKTDELNLTLMKRRNLDKLKQVTFLLWVFLLFLKNKLKLENTTKWLHLQSVCCSYLKQSFKIQPFLIWL